MAEEETKVPVASEEAEIAPSPTVYINNLEESIKLDALVETLRGLFAEYGTILDIVAKKSLYRKGQAFVVFDNTESAQNAIDDLNGFDVAGKQIRCEFAKTRSDATVKKTGNAAELEEHVRVRKEEKVRKQAEREKKESNKRPAPSAATSTKTKVARIGDDGPPSNVLIVQGIPEDYDDNAMSAVFGRLPGFQDFHSVPGRKGLGFVHYDTVEAATRARTSLASLELGGSKMTITYRKA